MSEVGFHPLRCRCGSVRGRVEVARPITRTICYCNDCQAFAHFLGTAEEVLDSDSGTDIVAVEPWRVRFTKGAQRLSCVCLTPRTVRWYASCCRTPIANTPADWRTAHVGLIHTGLDTQCNSLEQSFGPVLMRVARSGARGPVPPTPAWQVLKVTARYLFSLMEARMSGDYVVNPFFHDGKPCAAPQHLSEQEYEQLKASF